jgi:small subunit ribosomal protein S18
MSDQVNPTPEQGDDAIVEVAAFEAVDAAGDVVEVVAAREIDAAGDVVEIVEVDEVVVDDEDGEDGEADDDDGRSGPEQYVEREKGDRRRVGTDVRIDDVNYKNVTLLSRFLDRRGRIMSRRKTRVSAKMQRRIVREVKRARHLALLPYTADQTRQVKRRR